MGQWKGRISLYKIKLSRGERATMDERIDDLLDAIKVNRELACQRSIYVLKENALMKKIWRVYMYQAMRPMRGAFFAQISIEDRIIKLLINEAKIGDSMELRLSQYNWVNETYDCSLNHPRGRRQLSLLVDGFDQLHEIMAEVMKYVK